MNYYLKFLLVSMSVYCSSVLTAQEAVPVTHYALQDGHKYVAHYDQGVWVATGRRVNNANQTNVIVYEASLQKPWPQVGSRIRYVVARLDSQKAKKLYKQLRQQHKS